MMVKRPFGSTRWALAILLASIGVACAGPDLPDAPNPPHIDHAGTPPPGTGQEPASSSVLPTAPHDGGQLAASNGGYLEFLCYPENGRELYFLFPYDSQLAPIHASLSAAAATLTIDGTTAAGTAATDGSDGSLFFYLYPTLKGSTHSIQATASVSGKSYSGSFSTP